MTDQVDYYRLASPGKESRLRDDGLASVIRRALVGHGKENQLDSTDFEELASEVYDLYEGLLIATNENGYELENLKPWRNRIHSLSTHKKAGDPYVNMEEIDWAAVRYLRLPIRVDALDRVLVDALMASEIFSYLDHPVAARMKPSSLGCSIGGNLLLAALLLWVSDGAGWAIVVGILLLLWPFAGMAYFQKKSPQGKIFAAMRDSYQCMAGGGLTSISELRGSIQRAREAGVIWPNTLYVLLEDIADRRKAI